MFGTHPHKVSPVQLHRNWDAVSEVITMCHLICWSGLLIRFCFRLKLDRSQSLFYFVPQEKVNITVKLARLGNDCNGSPQRTTIPFTTHMSESEMEFKASVYFRSQLMTAFSETFFIEKVWLTNVLFVLGVASLGITSPWVALALSLLPVTEWTTPNGPRHRDGGLPGHQLQ